ncbi:hypothetical protein HanIR_Chr07g0328721 [Helianthus annuus]|nr:hypothetical protein HanIR_Chr07g0328721 [Helianthus annuus]
MAINCCCSAFLLLSYGTGISLRLLEFFIFFVCLFQRTMERNLFSDDVDDAWNLVGCLDTHFKFCILFVLYSITHVVFVSNSCN